MNANQPTSFRRIRRAVAVALLGVVAGSGLFYAAPAMAQNVMAPPLSAPAAYLPLDMNALEQLLAPIALYPDSVLGQVLAACTHPDQVAAAASNPAAVDAAPFDPSVEAVAQFPDVLNYLASNYQYMNQLGAAYVYQPADVTAAIQNLRAQAMTAGNLASCDQFQVVNNGGVIDIVRCDPNLIYIPIYDCRTIFFGHDRFHGGRFDSPIHFGAGIHVRAGMRGAGGIRGGGGIRAGTTTRGGTSIRAGTATRGGTGMHYATHQRSNNVRNAPAQHQVR